MSRQMTVPFPSRLDNHYCEEEEGNYRPKLMKAYEASHINDTIPQKEKDPRSFTLPCYINNVCFDNDLVELGASVSVMPLLTYLNLGVGELAHTRLIVELADRIVKYPKGIAENVLVGIGKFVFPIDFIILDMPEDIKVPLILGRPFLSTAHAKIDVYKRKITLRVGEENIIFKSVKPASSLIRMVYMLSLRERMKLDLEARLMGETLVFNRSLDPFLEDYIELNDLNKPFELRRNQGDDLMHTIEEGETSIRHICSIPYGVLIVWTLYVGIKSLLMLLGVNTTKERGFGSLPSSTETNPRDQVKSIATTIEADSHSIRRIGSPQYAVSTGQNKEEGNYGLKFAEAYGSSHINDTIPRKEKDPRSFTLPCYINNVCFDNAIVDLGASISVMPLLTYLNLGLGELAHTRLTMELADRTVKYPKRIAENMLVGIGKFVFPVDFIICDMIEDIKVPLILGRPFLSTARAKIDVYKRKITLRVGEENIIFKSVKPASSLIRRVYMLSLREIIELDLEARLMGENLVLNRSLDPFLEDYIKLNDLNKPFELRRNQGDDLMSTIEEGEVIKEFRTRDEDLDNDIDDYPNYCDSDKKIHIDYFAVLEDMDAYRDEGMGDVIFGEPFLREVGIKAKCFKGIITLYKNDDEVTYQMVRSRLRFKDHTNEQCNKSPPLLKTSIRCIRSIPYGILIVWTLYVRIKSLLMLLGVNTAKVRVTAVKHNLVLLVILGINLELGSTSGIKACVLKL
ncbi:retrovirus-related pol polyprotein from transposon TNT 1-94 [Tanacetum coccineum]